MKILKTTILLLCVITFIHSAAEADEPVKPLKVYLGLGITVPASPESFRSDHKTGFQVFTGLGYSFTRYIEMIGRLEMHVVSVDSEERFGTTVEFDGGGLDMLFIGADVRLSGRRANSSWRPFGLAGGGWLRMSQSNINTPLAFEQYAPLLFENQTRFYYNLGAGVDLRPVHNLTVFLLIRYTEIRQDDENLKFVPITLGLKF